MRLVPISDRLRQIYLEPEVHDDYRVESGRCDVEGVVRFLCDEHAFGGDRVVAALERAFGPAPSSVGAAEAVLMAEELATAGPHE